MLLAQLPTKRETKFQVANNGFNEELDKKAYLNKIKQIFMTKFKTFDIRTSAIISDKALELYDIYDERAGAGRLLNANCRYYKLIKMCDDPSGCRILCLASKVVQPWYTEVTSHLVYCKDPFYAHQFSYNFNTTTCRRIGGRFSSSRGVYSPIKITHPSVAAYNLLWHFNLVNQAITEPYCFLDNIQHDDVVACIDNFLHIYYGRIIEAANRLWLRVDNGYYWAIEIYGDYYKAVRAIGYDLKLAIAMIEAEQTK